jgi:hypothetical protein
VETTLATVSLLPVAQWNIILLENKLFQKMKILPEVLIVEQGVQLHYSIITVNNRMQLHKA